MTTISLRPLQRGSAATMSASAPGWRSSRGPARRHRPLHRLVDPRVIDQGTGMEQRTTATELAAGTAPSRNSFGGHERLGVAAGGEEPPDSSSQNRSRSWPGPLGPPAPARGPGPSIRTAGTRLGGPGVVRRHGKMPRPPPCQPRMSRPSTYVDAQRNCRSPRRGARILTSGGGRRLGEGGCGHGAPLGRTFSSRPGWTRWARAAASRRAGLLHLGGAFQRRPDGARREGAPSSCRPR